jgi:ligand-binding SRPBCC domain-containing protein
MATVHLTTFIKASQQIVFDCSRSITLHKTSMQHTNERAIDGVTSGLIGLHETVTWRARHLFKDRLLQVKITAMQSPVYFKDEMVKGDFKSMQHEHHFKPVENGTIMIDVMHFSSPHGMMGKLLDKFFLTNYMRQLLAQRNEVIKQYAESNKWKAIM